MDKSSCDAYIYAKVSSRISKAFSGKNSEKLFAVKSLSELYGLLFNEEVPSIPESLLAREIEIKSERKFVSEYISLLDCYSHAEDFKTWKIRTFKIRFLAGYFKNNGWLLFIMV